MAGPMLTGAAPLPSASVIIVRDEPMEVLLLRRHARSSFVPNAWVFPGGIAEQLDTEVAHEIADGSTLAAMRVTGARETFEESGIWLGSALDDADQKRRRLLAGNMTFRQLLAETTLDLEQLVWTSRWITPVGVPKRFDTYFFLARASRDARATAEQTETVDVLWIHPADALARHAAGEMQMVFPTLRNLEALAGFTSAEELIASRQGITIEAIEPILVNGIPTLR